MIHGRVLRGCGKQRSTPLKNLDPVIRLFEGNFFDCLSEVDQERRISYRLPWLRSHGMDSGLAKLLYPCCFATSGENAFAQSCQITHHGAIALGRRPYEGHRKTLRLYVQNGYMIDPATIVMKVNAHPPTSIVLVVPFGLLPFPRAMLLFNLVSLSALILTLWIVARQLRIAITSGTVAFVVIALLCCGPLRENLVQGQLSLLVLLLLTSAWAAERSHRPLLAGFLIGLVSSIKLFPLFLLLPYVAAHKVNVILASALTLIGVAAITTEVLGIGVYRSYFVDVLPQFEWFRTSWNNTSLLGFWSRLFDPASAITRTWQNSQPIILSPASCWLGYLACLATLTGPLLFVAAFAKPPISRDHAFALR